MKITRRRFLEAAGGTAVSALAGCSAMPTPSAASSSRATRSVGRVVVVGGGYAGATAAKYLRVWSGGAIDVTLVEREPAFVSCPLSNLVLAGTRDIADLTVPYDALVSRHGVRLVRDTAAAVDPVRREVRLAGGPTLPCDRLVLAPGVDFLWREVPSLDNDEAQARVLHAWKAGAQTVALRRQLEAMHDGGVVVISVPVAPFRCPPGPYERACQIAWYLKRTKSRSKVLVLDGNPDVISKPAIFKRVWAEDYAGIVEYQPNYVLTDVDVATLTAKFETQDDVRADVLNVVPPQSAGAVAHAAGVVTANGKWCEVDFLSMESIRAPGVHVLGDAIQIAPAMPKSGHMANQHGKVCAAAITATLRGEAVDAAPVMTNTCYSYVSDRAVAHVASVHRYDAAKKTMEPVAGAGGLSPAANEAEAPYAAAWARNIWADMLA